MPGLGSFNLMDASLIASALRLAAEKYGENAAALRADRHDDYARLAVQFDVQRADALRIAEEVEEQG